MERKLAQVYKQLQAQTKEIRQALVEPADEEIEEATAVLNDELGMSTASVLPRQQNFKR